MTRTRFGHPVVALILAVTLLAGPASGVGRDHPRPPMEAQPVTSVSARRDRDPGGRIGLTRVPGSTTRAVDVPLGVPGSPRGARVLIDRTVRLRTDPFAMVGLTWRGNDPLVRIRVHRPGTGWSPWRRADPLTDGGEESSRHGSSPWWVGRADAIGLRVRRPAPHLTLALIDSRRSPATSRRQDASTQQPRRHRHGLAQVLLGAAPRPPMFSRRDWGADESWRNGGPWYTKSLRQVHIHHTANSNHYSRGDVPALLRGIYRYHTHNLGWSDIGYNFLVDRFGRIWVGRAGGVDVKVRGAHTLGFNERSVGVAVIGDFTSTTPSSAVVDALVGVAAWKLDTFYRDPLGTTWQRSTGSDLFPAGTRVKLPVIDGHRDTNQTACPGERLYRLLPEIRRRTARRVEQYPSTGRNLVGDLQRPSLH